MPRIFLLQQELLLQHEELRVQVKGDTVDVVDSPTTTTNKLEISKKHFQICDSPAELISDHLNLRCDEPNVETAVKEESESHYTPGLLSSFSLVSLFFLLYFLPNYEMLYETSGIMQKFYYRKFRIVLVNIGKESFLNGWLSYVPFKKSDYTKM